MTTSEDRGTSHRGLALDAPEAPRGPSRRGGSRGVCVLLGMALALGALPAVAWGQPGQADRVDRLSAIFSGMSMDTGVRVMTPGLFIEYGAFRGLEPQSVRIAYEGTVVPVELGDIRSVQVERRHPVRGMLWGLGSGLLVGSVSGLLVGSFYCEDPVDCESQERRGALIGGATLGAVGGIAGFVIGKHRISWSPVFP